MSVGLSSRPLPVSVASPEGCRTEGVLGRCPILMVLALLGGLTISAQKGGPFLCLDVPRCGELTFDFPPLILLFPLHPPNLPPDLLILHIFHDPCCSSQSIF